MANIYDVAKRARGCRDCAHARDAAGHFQLGMTQGQTDAAKGLAHLDRAIALKPDFAEALSARGALNYQQGKPEAALADLLAAAKLRPRDATNLDRLGQTYLALDRTADAVSTLRRERFMMVMAQPSLDARSTAARMR